MPVTLLPGLDIVKNKLQKIHNNCNPEAADEEDGKSGKKQKDQYLVVKEKCYGMLTIVREKIRHRFQVMKERGNNVEAIQLGVKIHSMISELEKSIINLQTILQKQAGGSLLRRRLNAEELEHRFQDLSVLKKHVQECKTSHHGNRDLDMADFEEEWATGSSDDPSRSALFGSTQNRIEVDKTGREIDGSEQAVINKWEARDKQFDQMLDEIAVDVELLGQHAANIGAAAERQGHLIDEVGKKVDVCDDGVKDLSAKVKDIIDQDKNSTFCCRIILLVVLLALIGIIINKVTK